MLNGPDYNDIPTFMLNGPDYNDIPTSYSEWSFLPWGSTPLVYWPYVGGGGLQWRPDRALSSFYTAVMPSLKKWE